MDTTSLLAAALSGTVSLTDRSTAELIADYGKEAVDLIAAIASVDMANGLNDREVQMAVIDTMKRDPRVFMIQLARRLQDMRSADLGNSGGPVRRAREALHVLAPVARQLNMSSAASMLEDYAFALLHPKEYQSIAGSMADSKATRNIYIKAAARDIGRDLSSRGVSATVDADCINCYAVYKMASTASDSRIDFAADVVVMRVMVFELRDCYTALGMLHARWPHLNESMQNRANRPQSDASQGLRVIVAGPDGKPIDAQIATASMRRLSDHGVAAFWRYRELAGQYDSSGSEHDRRRMEIEWSNFLERWQSSAPGSDEFGAWLAALLGRGAQASADDSPGQTSAPSSASFHVVIDLRTASHVQVADAVELISEIGGVDISEAAWSGGGRRTIRFKVEICDMNHLECLFQALRAMPGVERVDRVA